MKYLTGKINKLPGTALIVFIFFMDTAGQTGEPGKGHQFKVFVGEQSITDDHLILTSAKFLSKGLIWSYSNHNVYQQRSLTVNFAYGIGRNSINKNKALGFLVEYKNAFSINKNKNSKFNNYTGYSVKTNSQFIKSGEQNSWVGINTLSIYNSLNYSWKKNRFSFDLSIPLAGFVSRPDADKEYKSYLNEMLYNSLSDPVFTSLHNHRELNMSFQYSHSISSSLNFSVGFSYLNRKIMVHESNFRSQSHLLQTGLSFLLKGNK